MQALTLYTYNGAYVGFEEKKKGTLEPGKFADFIVIDRDILSVPTEELKDVKVLRNYVGGKAGLPEPGSSQVVKRGFDRIAGRSSILGLLPTVKVSL